MYKQKQFIKVKGKLIQLGYDKYTQDADFHNHNEIIALNNKFPNLVGYGFLMYLKELMAENPACKIRWDEDTVQKMSNMMNMESKLIRDIVNFCIKELKILRKIHTWRELERSEEFYLIYPDFMEELIWLQAKMINQESEIRRNANIKEDGVKYERTIAKKREKIEKIKSILVLTEDIKNKTMMFYPDINFQDAWDMFVEMCTDQYYRWNEELNPENYEQTFYAYLNKYTAKIVIQKD